MSLSVTLPKRPKGPLRLRDLAGFVAGVILWILLKGVLWFLEGRRRRETSHRPGTPIRLLITGRMDSKNWCLSHLMPLTQAANVAEIILVLDGKIETGVKARQISVPRAIGWFRPRAIARSLWAVRVALAEKPDVIMAYSFFPPGVFALVAARLTGAAAIVQLAGGPVEIESGGISMDIPLVPEFLRTRLVPLCRQLAQKFDAVVVRGRRGAAYCREVLPSARVEIIPGSVNPARFPVENWRRSVDIVFVGRIVPIKQPDHVCEVIARVVARRPGLRAVVAGTGPLLPAMKQMASEKGLRGTIRFAGHVERVEGLLARSRIFLLTSYSEGLSIALAEAMMAGAVPVVANVGDLGELVENGRTGWLIPSGDFDSYAERIVSLLEDPQMWVQMSACAREKALANNGLEAVTRRWESTFSEVVEGRTLGEAAGGNLAPSREVSHFA